MSHTFCRTQKKQKKKILLYRKIYCERQHQLTLFFVRAVQKDCNKAYACTKSHKNARIFACFARRQIQHINHVQKTYKERKKKNGKKKKRQKRRTGRTGTVK